MPYRPRADLCRGALLVSVLLLANSADAAAKTARKSAADAASAPAKTPILSPAQLRDCLKKKDDLRVRSDDALKEKAALGAGRDEVAASGTSLADELVTLDRSDEAQVDAYNAKVAARDKQIEAYQARVTAFNARADAVNVSKENYAAACESRRYDEQDLTDVKRKK